MKYTSQEIALLGDADTIDDICISVSSGGTLPEWCEAHGVRYGLVSNWINTNPEALSQYAKATVSRAEYFEQTIFRQLRAIATLDIRQAYDQDGNPRPVTEWPDDLAQAVAGLEVDSIPGGGGKTTKLKMLDKLKAIELLMKNRKMLTDRVEVHGKVTLEAMLEASWKEDEAAPKKIEAQIFEATPVPGVLDSGGGK